MKRPSCQALQEPQRPVADHSNIVSKDDRMVILLQALLSLVLGVVATSDDNGELHRSWFPMNEWFFVGVAAFDRLIDDCELSRPVFLTIGSESWEVSSCTRNVAAPRTREVSTGVVISTSGRVSYHPKSREGSVVLRYGTCRMPFETRVVKTANGFRRCLIRIFK